MLSFCIFLILAVFVSFCFSQEEFRCKPKPGCQIAQCDPVSARWTNLDSHVIEQLEKAEFPITCFGKKKMSKGVNQEELNNLRQEMKKNNDEHLTKVEELEAKMEKLQKSGQRSSNEVIEKNTIISSLQTSIQTLQSENKKMLEDIQTLRRFSPKCEDGDIYYGDYCFWCDVTTRNFAESESKCKSRQSTMGHIIDKSHYDVMMGKLRKQIPSGLNVQGFWLGLRRNPSTEAVTITANGWKAPFLQWRGYMPIHGAAETNIFLDVDNDALSASNGMGNCPPARCFAGVICQYKSL